MSIGMSPVDLGVQRRVFSKAFWHIEWPICPPVVPEARAGGICSDASCRALGLTITARSFHAELPTRSEQSKGFSDSLFPGFFSFRRPDPADEGSLVGAGERFEESQRARLGP
jgi:hypothetical protein